MPPLSMAKHFLPNNLLFIFLHCTHNEKAILKIRISGNPWACLNIHIVTMAAAIMAVAAGMIVSSMMKIL